MRIQIEDLSTDVSERNLMLVFAQYGRVRSIEIVRDCPYGKGQPVAFVQMESDAEAELAMRCLRGVGFLGRHLQVYAVRP